MPPSKSNSLRILPDVTPPTPATECCPPYVRRERTLRREATRRPSSAYPGPVLLNSIGIFGKVGGGVTHRECMHPNEGGCRFIFVGIVDPHVLEICPCVLRKIRDNIVRISRFSLKEFWGMYFL